MVVGRSQARERQPQKEDRIGPLFGLFNKRAAIGCLLLPQENQAQDADQRKRGIGDDVEEVGDAKRAAPIGKVVVRLALGDGKSS